MTEPRKMVFKDQAPSDTSDGYHTFDELYDHRRSLTAALGSLLDIRGKAWRSKAHHPDDNPMFDGHFIVGLNLGSNYGTVTYHYGIEHWNDFQMVKELDHAPKWDGAPPGETVRRLLAAAKDIPLEAQG